MTRLEVSWICAQDVRSSRVHGSNAGDDPLQVRALLRQSRPFSVRSAHCVLWQWGQFRNRSWRIGPRLSQGQHRMFKQTLPGLADQEWFGGPGDPVSSEFFFLSVHWVVCTFTRQRPFARVEGSAKAAAAAAICTKLHEALENFAIRNRQIACPARAGQGQGWPNTCRFQSGLPFFWKLPSGALVHLAVFSPSAALAGLSWLINRSLPIFMLRLASSSPTLGAPRHRERARACRRTIHCLQCEPLLAPAAVGCQDVQAAAPRAWQERRETGSAIGNQNRGAPLQLSVGDHGGR